MSPWSWLSLSCGCRIYRTRRVHYRCCTGSSHSTGEYLRSVKWVGEIKLCVSQRVEKGVMCKLLDTVMKLLKFVAICHSWNCSQLNICSNILILLIYFFSCMYSNSISSWLYKSIPFLQDKVASFWCSFNIVMKFKEVLTQTQTASMWWVVQAVHCRYPLYTVVLNRSTVGGIALRMTILIMLLQYISFNAVN